MIFDRAAALRAGIAFVIFAGMLFAALVAWARDPQGVYVNSPHKTWYETQHNSKGDWCCNEADAHPYFGDYTLNTDGSVTVEGETIPKEQVLTGTNPTGHAVWWRLGQRTYCFAPGTLM